MTEPGLQPGRAAQTKAPGEQQEEQTGDQGDHAVQLPRTLRTMASIASHMPGSTASSMLN